MSFNIRLQVESDKDNAWTQRKQDAIDLMSYYHPDYFGVQEALPQQMKDIKNGLKNYDYVGVGRDDGKEKGEFSAIFYDTNRLQVINSGTFWLSETPEKPSKVGMQLTTECVLTLFSKTRSLKRIYGA